MDSGDFAGSRVFLLPFCRAIVVVHGRQCPTVETGNPSSVSQAIDAYAESACPTASQQPGCLAAKAVVVCHLRWTRTVLQKPRRSQLPRLQCLDRNEEVLL